MGRAVRRNVVTDVVIRNEREGLSEPCNVLFFH